MNKIIFALILSIAATQLAGCSLLGFGGEEPPPPSEPTAEQPPAPSPQETETQRQIAELMSRIDNLTTQNQNMQTQLDVARNKPAFPAAQYLTDKIQTDILEEFFSRSTVEIDTLRDEVQNDQANLQSNLDDRKLRESAEIAAEISAKFDELSQTLSERADEYEETIDFFQNSAPQQTPTRSGRPVRP
ncbi:MAG: hypothetical protein NUW37_10470 [Planctomycetes bacterium]|nr:hypothetical protein [Planctomycetota bacterium]